VLEGVPYLLEINPRFGGSLAPLFFAFMRSLGE
jgi:predicted ATP-grasp superfamily ATP-dependent carboligase